MSRVIHIAKVDTTTDWFEGAVEAVHEELGEGYRVRWDLIDDDANTLGDMVGWFEDSAGNLYRAEFDEAYSGTDSECVVLRELPE